MSRWSTAAALAFGLSVAPARAQLVTSVPDVERVHRDHNVGQFVARDEMLTPCEPDRTTAFSENRPTTGIWAARFTVLRAVPGDWTLIVRASDGTLEWRQQISAAHAAGDFWETDVFLSPSVSISVVGPGGASPACPLVRLDVELSTIVKALPRGIVGNRDDRIAEGSPEFASLSDAAVIGKWAPAVFHLKVVTRTGFLVPCSGFFISRRVLMTAAHCIGNQAEASKATLFLNGKVITGKALFLLMAQGPLDFTLVKVDGADQSTTLRLEDNASTRLVLWQFPEQAGRLIAVADCEMDKQGGNRLVHRCDSTGGTSGSPIQDRSAGGVLALHTEGCLAENMTPQCRNSGVLSSAIRAQILSLETHLKAKDPDAAAEVLAVLRPVK